MRQMVFVGADGPLPVKRPVAPWTHGTPTVDATQGVTHTI
jgi:hypothetical protein